MISGDDKNHRDMQKKKLDEISCRIVIFGCWESKGGKKMRSYHARVRGLHMQVGRRKIDVTREIVE